ncbi:hypothetical protein SAMN05444123_12034 [Rhodopseudomonas pseudopalustris]|uniref:Uncharacterized protein n=1 Tax=Rhodopseudomonas pseudopalustris TaxID=1513892 RepID=A0A1H8XD31_9BRAD|nr:hypothetical protein SAMN05444123_12034 [Rhodopseudomonas pseudopalustris]
MTPVPNREATAHPMTAYEMNERRACRVIRAESETIHYRFRRPLDIEIPALLARTPRRAPPVRLPRAARDVAPRGASLSRPRAGAPGRWLRTGLVLLQYRDNLPFRDPCSLHQSVLSSGPDANSNRRKTLEQVMYSSHLIRLPQGRPINAVEGCQSTLLQDSYRWEQYITSSSPGRAFRNADFQGATYVQHCPEPIFEPQAFQHSVRSPP